MAPEREQESKVFSIQVSRHSKRVYVKTRRFPALLVVGLLVAPWVLVALYHFHYLGGTRDASQPNSRSLGAWGKLDCFDFITDPPDEFIQSSLFPATEAVWHFESVSRDKLKELFTAAELSPQVSAELAASAEMTPVQTWQVKPPDDVLMNMSPNGRANLYRELIKRVENSRQIDPFIFNQAQLDAWLADARLEPATLTNLRKLLYPNRDRVLLADTATLLKFIPTEAEKRKLLTVLLRRATVMLKLRVEQKMDISAMTEYWGSGGRQKEVRPLLEALSMTPGGMREDILMLLPPFARHRLYMYPLPDQNPVAMRRDCHWSAFNFYNDPADDKYTNPQNVVAAMSNDYVELMEKENPTMGDVAMFKTQDNRIVHSCVYIADEFYFTKNGPSHISPWVLMRLTDIMAFFPAYDNLTVHYYRKK